MNLNGKVALVTGGGKALGKVISLQFAQAGADLVLVSRTKEALEQTAREIRALGRKALVYPGDASVEEVAERAIEKSLTTFGKIDILVNNCGIEGPIAPIIDIAKNDWDYTLAVNLTSAYLFCKKVIPSMKKRKSGCIINMSSMAGTRGHFSRSSYCATKWAIIGMSRAVAQEVGSDNIRVNVICPGAVAGERYDKILHKRAEDYGISFNEMVDLTVKETPLRRILAPEEIASVALFLASDAARGITGEEILITWG